ncbi:hypothetical protein BJV78DRAFT_365070 [Lactifluus subvellereus]|nr:hypothetical protein BJV78DRAFT_365070 [Lactifluus subvellereus]
MARSRVMVQEGAEHHSPFTFMLQHRTHQSRRLYLRLSASACNITHSWAVQKVSTLRRCRGSCLQYSHVRNLTASNSSTESICLPAWDRRSRRSVSASDERGAPGHRMNEKGYFILRAVVVPRNHGQDQRLPEGIIGNDIYVNSKFAGCWFSEAGLGLVHKCTRFGAGKQSAPHHLSTPV